MSARHRAHRETSVLEISSICCFERRGNMLCRLDLPGGVLLLRVGHVTFLVRVCLAARIVSRTIALLYIAQSIDYSCSHFLWARTMAIFGHARFSQEVRCRLPSESPQVIDCDPTAMARPFGAKADDDAGDDVVS